MTQNNKANAAMNARKLNALYALIRGEKIEATMEDDLVLINAGGLVTAKPRDILEAAVGADAKIVSLLDEGQTVRITAPRLKAHMLGLAEIVELIDALKSD